MPSTTFPNLFLIGAMKAGTSSLHEYLHQHPQIFMARRKEPQYFAPHVTRQGLRWGEGGDSPEPGIGWYLRLFADAGDVKYAGESSTSYTARPWVEGCARRIHAFNPQARLIYLLRDPVERTISHYWHFVADGREDLDPLPALQRKEEYVARSDYLRQLEPYWQEFGREAVHVLTLEDLRDSPRQTLNELFAWLGVDSGVEIDTTMRWNVGSESLLQTRRGLVWLDTLRKHWRVQQLAEHTPAAVAGLLRACAYRRVDRSRVDMQPAIDWLRPILQDRTRRLQDELGRRFPRWRTLWNEPPADARVVPQAPLASQTAA